MSGQEDDSTGADAQQDRQKWQGNDGSDDPARSGFEEGAVAAGGDGEETDIGEAPTAGNDDTKKQQGLSEAVESDSALE